MLLLQDEFMNITRATITKAPNLSSSSKWFYSLKYIDNTPINFYFIKGNGAHFYFEFRGKWHKILKNSIKTEEISTRFNIVN